MDRTIEGKAYINGTFEQCCIGITDGKISDIKKILKSGEHYNFGNKLILPAGIDLHVHFRDPGFPHKEDFSTGSMAAAFGGISCVFDMPNTRPQTITTNAILEKKDIAKKKSFTDFGLYAAVTDNNIEKINDLSKHCSGFKIFLGTTTNSIRLSEQRLKDALSKAHQSNKITLIHAENEQCLKKNRIVEHDLKDHLRSRPSACEQTSIKNIIDIGKNTTTAAHVCHLSSCEGFEMLRSRPKSLSVGVTPHHLFFDIENIDSKHSFYKTNPPIRSRFDRETLWNGVKNGFIDVLESDHAPHTLEEKENKFDQAPTGIPGVEVMYPLFLAEAKKDHLSFSMLISLLCNRPAELMGIPKGKIEVGLDADVVVVDLKKECKIKEENLHSKCGWSPFEGFHAIFPSHVFIRGEKLIEDHEIQVKQGFGNFVGE